MENVSVETPLRAAGRLSYRRLGWLFLFILIAAALAVVLVPAWLIQPFKAQTPQGLQVAYRLRQLAPAITVLDLVAAVGLACWLWPGTRSWWRRAVLVLLVLITLLPAWFARQNHFEWMFRPLPNAAYVRASEADFVAGGEMVMTVELNGDAAAYPVRQMAYHHVVQDVVGRTPVVVTY